MVPLEQQNPTIIRPSEIGTDVKYEPPLQIGFGINDETVEGANAIMGRTILPPGGEPDPTHYHGNNNVCWHVVSGKIKAWFARSDLSHRKDMVLEAGDFIFIPAGTVHVIANPSEDEESVLVFCYIGVGNTNEAGNVWLDEK
ncbi:MAG: cupin domain-containing protein [Rhodospirillaceae bacterium]|jgi:uncharacterized RmlC-like cupin family protein|nr:cupin domain-containing protein [Rhodospirillales bacterium]MBT3906475.1 cupin domain-containing protein [Rhodospirillaceae bacterium]MBT4699663.1 cupin domain-containing protein [Rhodospirillaceae bacterium]MBT5034274.1 cupin domain-containing protein [Rhodospirillaceae bacterium]MBT6218153.1 cupin domain-containing protein [Rhodospirillaceae bacterium]